MQIIAFLLIGLLTGWAASVFVAGHSIKVVRDIVVGIVGAFVGGFMFTFLNIPAYGFWQSIGMSIIGAVIFLYIANTITRHMRPSNSMKR